MSRTKKFFYNSISSAFLQVVTMIVGMITPRILLQYYGSEINGLVSSINQFIAYFTIVEAGLAGAAIYALYKPLADNNYKSINGVVAAAKRFYTQSGYIFISLVLGLSIIYPSFVKSNILSPISVGMLVMILGVNGALEFFTLSKYRVLLTADQKTYIISLASIVQILLNTTIIICLSIFHVNIVVVRAVALLAIFLRSFILMIYVKRNYKYIDYNVKPNYQSLNKRWDALYLEILGSVQIGTPVILATIFMNLQSVSIYSVYNMVISGVNGILGIFINGLSASFGDVIARGENKTLQRAYKDFEFSYYSIITIIYSISMITIMPFIKIYTRGITDANYNIPLLGFFFVLNGLLYNIKTPQGMLVISAGMYKETRVQASIQGIIILLLGIILTPRYGLIGILIASCISNLYRDIELCFFVPKNITKIPVKETILRILLMILETLIICVPFIFIKIDINSWIKWILFATVVGIYAIVVVCIFGVIFNKSQFKSAFLRTKLMLKIK